LPRVPHSCPELPISIGIGRPSACQRISISWPLAVGGRYEFIL
jgi:hypothetical protein